MKNWLAIIFKIFLIIALFVFVGIAIFAGVVWAKWPLWVCFFVVAGIIGIFLGILFFRKLFLKRKEQKFVSQIIEQDNAYLKSAGKKEREVSQEMQAKWKDAMASLKKSHLKGQGNPLYVLPWYMIIGKSGTGKTTAIKSAKLSSSFAEVSSISGISGTRNCDWWFFEQAILIDTAGRYAVPVDEDKDSDEWQKFLNLLAKYRKKEPLNGLIVTVSADSLNDMGAEGLEAYGRDIRKRLDELMRILEAKFPVYIMVTKCDLIQGMTHFSDCFSDDVLGQTMGIVNHGLEKDPMGLVSDCFKTMGDRIRDIRLLTMQKLQKKEISPELILFPSELEKIRPGFEAFIKGVFQENPYQETPFFRGINFSSGCQEGTPYSHFLKDLGLIGEREVLPGTSRGLFLHDFFSGLLPSDRGLFKVTQRGAAWKRLTRNIGFAAWTAIIIAVCGILSFSFVKNLQTIKTASVQFAGPQILQGELVSDIFTLEKFRTTIHNVEKSNTSWWIPRLGLSESINVEFELKKKYCTLMEKRFIEPFDKKMADNMAYFDLSTPVDISIEHVEHLVKRINLIEAKLLGEPVEVLEKMKRPIFNAVEIRAEKDIAEDIRLKIKDLYIHYLVWQNDTQNMNRKMNDLQKWLARILSIKGSNLNWLVIWTDSDPELSPYTLADFWGKQALEETESKTVASSFTLKGKEKIDGFINEIEEALTNPLMLAGQKREFYKWYKTAYLTAWLNFAAEFTKGKKALVTREQWQNISDSVWHQKGPYFSLLQTIPHELKLFSGQQELPDWTNLVQDINNLYGQAAAIKARKSATTGVLGKAASTVKSKLSRVSGRLSNTINNNLSAEAMMKSGKIFLSYQEALSKLPSLVSSQRAAFELATSIYTEDPATSLTPFFTANQAFTKLKATMVYSGKESSYIWKILEGPLEFYQEYSLKEASCRLQKKWEEDVLMEMKDISDKSNVNTLLLGPSGFVTRFLKGPGKPFIKRGLKKGFYSAKVNGKDMDLNTYFFKFLTRGVSASRPSKKSYSVKISGYPTSANDGVQVQPHATLLKLVCTGSTTTLENLNYPVRKVFTWSPQSECEVVFTIKIGSLALVKKIQGPLCFPKFFKAFPNGQRKFIPSDFPDHEDDLKRMGVKFIIAKYKFTGDKSVAKLLRSAPGRIPTEIVKCWE
ncbi:MAG: hypothetical protein K8S13_17470 [Desulfobacula sp.]|uniref:type VI secretion protein IcmF/TssM N-terminal domain-containing protein n=1 Tax=Desulfobacula sp. TaxID=2593537 RepID=UPI0025BD1172|nr:type VI secretion protein IcmF/TssM N-terminal domain-containing protein [Desulfobacula sp.]MCD4721630.1 hypothetical protein [Desulfobacula sp.]